MCIYRIISFISRPLLLATLTVLLIFMCRVGLARASGDNPRGKIFVSTNHMTVSSRVVRSDDQKPSNDDGGAMIEVIINGKRTIAGKGYLPDTIVELWRRGPLSAGPDIIIGASTGGSHCEYDVISITENGENNIQVIPLCNQGAPLVFDRNGAPELTVTFELGGFHAPQSVVSFTALPLFWNGLKFIANFGILQRMAPDTDGIKAIRMLMHNELVKFVANNHWRDLSDVPTPRTVNAILGLILEGQAIEARSLLIASWPINTPGMNEFWQQLCLSISNHPLWKMFELQQLPQANVILEGASNEDNRLR